MDMGTHERLIFSRCHVRRQMRQSGQGSYWGRSRWLISLTLLCVTVGSLLAVEQDRYRLLLSLYYLTHTPHLDSAATWRQLRTQTEQFIAAQQAQLQQTAAVEQQEIEQLRSDKQR
ncbi:hypothetical protein M1466_01435 [Candidatus Dependentiae bacterium]|nr:hypothetical protein [Candidatus Dependentiae bacterium]